MTITDYDPLNGDSPHHNRIHGNFEGGCDLSLSEVPAHKSHSNYKGESSFMGKKPGRTTLIKWSK